MFHHLQIERARRQNQIAALDRDADARRAKAAAVVAAMERNLRYRQSRRILGGFIPAPPDRRGVWPFVSAGNFNTRPGGAQQCSSAVTGPTA